MNDEDFCQTIGYTTRIKRDLAEKIRRITGELCKMDPNAITPGEDTENLNSRIPDGWDDVQFVMRLENILGFPLDGIRLPNFTVMRFFFLYKKAKPLNYGEWVKSVVEMLAPIVAERLGKAGVS
jgi:hypothetical protein